MTHTTLHLHDLYRVADVALQATQAGLSTLTEQYTSGDITAAVYNQRYAQLESKLHERAKECDRLFELIMPKHS